MDLVFHVMKVGVKSCVIINKAETMEMLDRGKILFYKTVYSVLWPITLILAIDYIFMA